ncbi:hypothetical protein TVNIR_2192 [Thioalkalivibrio nitratireducens DSM 14787]|uniref:Dicarboxylate transport domain-containing protein n=1 Tax=Thioalkalivibrio nitratireducens (strain DSM 14787 / UNIQEM 213 / ALEN2) TaxID=1255043 RepID=L0DXS9_THIND|nr:hypothetical protein [Thioalkalivibrio nitratireducens]AGA33848.1 hypothetical protein TVNIR_2192 [Thioalkalivibrio nitratireducens DSM 14787]
MARCRFLQALAVVAVLLAVPGAGVAAGLQIEIDIGRAVHQAMDAENLRARVFLEQRQPRFELTADALSLPQPVGRVTELRLDCPAVDLGDRRLGCRDGRFSARAPGVTLDAAALEFHWDRSAGEIGFAMPWPGLFQGRGRIQGSADRTGLGLEFDLGGLDLSSLAASPLVPVPNLGVTIASGTLALSGRLDTREHLQSLRTDLRVAELAFSDAQGLRAGEGIAVAGRFVHRAGGFDIQLGFTDGAVFVDPWFLDFSEEGPVEMSVSRLQQTGTASWQAADALLRLGEHAVAHLQGLRTTGARLDRGEIRWEASRMDRVGELLLGPMLAGTVLGDSRYQGSGEGELSIAGGRLRAASASWGGFGLEDMRGRFGLDALSGQAHWRDDGPGQASFEFDRGGHLFGIPVGSFAVELDLEPRGVRVKEPVDIPTLDGALGVEILKVRMRPDGPEVEFEGAIRALNLETATRTLGWPPLSGKLAGVIPRVRYDIDGLRVDGRLLVQVFDGDIVLRDLRIRDLFGRAPTLEVSADIRRIELRRLTEAFDFGRVEGRVSGKAEDLLLVGWQPERMRLAIATADEDPGRRRISQRAVQNLTELGGGLQGAISAAFLQFFEDFGYRRIGFACDLEGKVCRMSGVADRADGSFVLVQGGGLPRIDVVGHNRRVDWPELIRRLNAVRDGPGPVVQ